MDRPTLGIIATSGDLFARELFKALSDRYHIEHLQGPDPYVDLVWCDWADQALVQLTRGPKHQPLIARLHSYEVFTGLPEQVRWDRVDALVFVADHIRRRIQPHIDVAADKIHLIPHGVDLARFSPRVEASSGRRTRLAWTGRLNPVKGVDLLPHLLLAAREIDDAFTLHIAGAFEDPRTEAAFHNALKVMGLTDAVELCGHLPHHDLPDWYRQHHYLLSSSNWESFQYAIAEGAACGLVPLVRQWEGADELYDDRFHLWATISQLTNHLARLHARDHETFTRQGLAARALIAERYSRERQVESTAAVIEGVLARHPRRFHSVRPQPTVESARPRLSAAMILKNEEQRLPACLESIRGLVDEIVVVDTGSTDRTCEIAAEFGAHIYHHPWTGDFSLHRNQSLDYATGDWVLIIDGDEVLEPGNLRRLLDQVHADPAIDSLSIQVDAVTRTGLGERFEAIRVFRREKGRYRYPVHNQLEGITGCLPSSGVITAFYVDTLEAKAARSLPLLFALAEQAEARAHAAFFIAKTYRALERFDDLRPWLDECKRLVPDQPGYVTFWLWEIEASLMQHGLEAAEAALAEALHHHPDFTELYRYQVAFALSRWQERVVGPSPYRAFTLLGDRFAVNIPAAANALGLPLEFREKSLAGLDLEASRVRGEKSVVDDEVGLDTPPPELRTVIEE